MFNTVSTKGLSDNFKNTFTESPNKRRRLIFRRRPYKRRSDDDDRLDY